MKQRLENQVRAQELELQSLTKSSAEAEAKISELNAVSADFERSARIARQSRERMRHQVCAAEQRMDLAVKIMLRMKAL